MERYASENKTIIQTYQFWQKIRVPLPHAQHAPRNNSYSKTLKLARMGIIRFRIKKLYIPHFSVKVSITPPETCTITLPAGI